MERSTIDRQSNRELSQDKLLLLRKIIYIYPFPCLHYRGVFSLLLKLKPIANTWKQQLVVKLLNNDSK